MIGYLRDIEKSFPIKDIGKRRQRVLKGISFDIKKGEVLGLVGLNGQGKSTTIKIMLGLLRPDRGDIKIQGHKPGEIDTLRHIAYLPENPWFFDNLNAKEFLYFIAKLRQIDKKRLKQEVEEMIKRVGLSGNEKKVIRKYSKGMVQRLGLAQAFLGDADFIILDEPLSGLDPEGRKMAKDLIKGHKKKQKTVFFTSHILEDIEQMADRVLIMNRGRIIKEVHRADLYNKTLEQVFIETIEHDRNN